MTQMIANYRMLKMIGQTRWRSIQNAVRIALGGKIKA